MSEMNPLIRNMKKPTRKNAINAMCAHCVGCTMDDLEVGFRHMIRDCTATQCPLYLWRPYKPSTSGDISEDVDED